MGFDLYGREPKTPKGEYFRNNIWWWRPLWDYVCEQSDGVLSEADKNKGSFNDGHAISAAKANKLAKLLNKQLESGEVLRYSKEYAAMLAAIPDEKCNWCDGTGDRKDLEPAEWKEKCGGCNSCHGKGTVRPFITNYPFSEENVREFAEFCEASGGFEIS